MKTLSRFVAKFTSLIVAVLSCFDRVRFTGYLPISNGPALEGFVDHVLQIRRCDFMAFAEQQSEALVDRARRKRRAKHGGGQQPVDVNELEIAANADDEKLLQVHEALEKLAVEDPVRAEVVKLHFFVGLTHAETAEVMRLSEKTVRRHWNFARVWLYRAIRENSCSG